MKLNNPSKKPDILKIQKTFEEKEKHNHQNGDNDRLISAKGIVYSSYIKHVDCCFFPKRLNTALKNVKGDNELHINRADKANTIAILDKHTYVDNINKIPMQRDKTSYLFYFTTGETSTLSILPLENWIEIKEETPI